MAIRAVAFDFGETLVYETRYWTEWAERLGLTPLDLIAQLGAAIERGEDHRSVLAAAGATARADPPAFEARDLYPDAAGTLASLRSRGFTTAVAGNFSAATAADVRTWGLAADVVVSSDDLGAEKPDPVFFARLADPLGVRPGELLYAGDRLDNDVAGALDAGCGAVFVRRGPWAAIQERRTESPVPAVDSLAQIAALLPELPTRN